jgi:hypothetical protein
MSVHPTIIQNIMPTIQSYIGNTSRATLFGSGLAYAIERNQWNQVPFVFLSPFAYASYHVTINQKEVMNWCKSTVKEFRK